MANRLGKLGRRSIPWGLIGMLGLVALAEGVLESHHLDFTRFYIHDWRVNGESARRSAPGCRILCFGDSLVKFGLVPAVLERRLGGRAYNLAVCDGQAASTYFLFRRAVEAGSRPEAVIVDFVPHLLATDPRHNLRQWPELVGLREGLDLGLSTRHAGFCASLALGSLLPSVKDRHEIRAAITAALQGRSASRRGEIPACVDRWKRDRGALLCAERPGYDGSVELTNPGYFPTRWKCHPTNERYIRRTLELAEQRGIRVFWLLPPIVPRFQSRRDQLGLEASYTQLVRRLTGEYTNLHVLDGRRAGFDHTHFIDPLHLSRQGAYLLSARVADSVARIGRQSHEAGRWASLSPDGSGADERPEEERQDPALVVHVSSRGRRP